MAQRPTHTAHTNASLFRSFRDDGPSSVPSAEGDDATLNVHSNSHGEATIGKALFHPLFFSSFENLPYISVVMKFVRSLFWRYEYDIIDKDL